MTTQIPDEEFRRRWQQHVGDLRRLRSMLTDEQTEVLEDTLDQLETIVDTAADRRDGGDR